MEKAGRKLTGAMARFGIPALALLALTAAIALLALSAYFGFTAEDAYISLRYARNLWQGNGPVFNPGEAINAMTAPLHVFLLAPLFALSDEPVLIGKALGIGAVLSAALLVAWPFRQRPDLAAAVAAMTLLPSPVLFWAVGGLETPFLGLAVSGAVPLVLAASEGRRGAYPALCLLAGTAFLLRYDSAFFFAPLLLVLAAVGFSWRKPLAWLAGAAAPALWLGFSLVYYRDLLPTSFYRKTPGLGGFWGNLEYIGVYLAATGVGVVLLAGATLALVRPGRGGRLPVWALGLGLCAVLLYGSTMARAHMMFQLRSLAPYFGAAAGFFGLLAARHALAPRWTLGAGFAVALAAVAAVPQIARVSVNGFATTGEYRALDVADYRAFMAALDRNAADIAADWAGTGRDRPPRVHTFAEGLLPFRLREAYVFGGLVSYRHDDRRLSAAQMRARSDYLHILAPRHGTVARQIGSLADAAPISEVTIFFDGSPQRVLVFRNPAPAPNPHPPRAGGG